MTLRAFEVAILPAPTDLQDVARQPARMDWQGAMHREFGAAKCHRVRCAALMAPSQQAGLGRICHQLRRYLPVLTLQLGNERNLSGRVRRREVGFKYKPKET